MGVDLFILHTSLALCRILDGTAAEIDCLAILYACGDGRGVFVDLMWHGMGKYFGLTARLLLLFCHTGGACALYSLPLDTGPARVVFSFENMPRQPIFGILIEPGLNKVL